ncbi:hypothetical protein EMCRGX_G002847 [Ephydatia muelleri]
MLVYRAHHIWSLHTYTVLCQGLLAADKYTVNLPKLLQGALIDDQYQGFYAIKPFPAMTSQAQPVPKRLISHWIARLGIPIDLSSDRGAQLTSQLWTSIDHYRLPPAIQWPSRKVPQTSEGSLTGSLALIGQLNYLGYFWEFVQHLRMT